LAEREGFLLLISRNANEDGPFLLKSCDISDLAFADAFVGSRLLASVCGL
jgi:hypothetical protein